ncbi:MAG: PH domain-containing protein [Thermoplasmata archaeon]
MGGRISIAVVVTYAVLILLFLFLPHGVTKYGWVPTLFVALLVFLLARYLSARYSIDDSDLRAFRLLGGRRIPLEEVRRIEYCSLRDLSPTGAFAGLGPLGWRGRMWSPEIGTFDSVFTDPARGVLVTAGENPLYLSPSDPEAFARELSRRVRSYIGPLERDVGHPGPG